MIDLRPDHLALVQGTLSAEIPEATVWVFGSRANWSSSDTSDLDLALEATPPLSRDHLGRLQSLFDTSTLPFRVDLVDWGKVDDDFRAAVDDDRILLQRPTARRGGSEAWHAVPLAECVHILHGGPSPRRRLDQPPGDLVPWIDGQGIEAGYPLGWRRVPREAGVTQAPAGSVLMVSRGSLLEERLPMVQAPLETAFGADLKALVARSGVDSDYLFYALLGQRDTLQGLRDFDSRGVLVIDPSALASFPLSLPPLDVQRRIATPLRALDQAIQRRQEFRLGLGGIARTLPSDGPAETKALRTLLTARSEAATREEKLLTEIRDALLPELISGRLDPRDSTLELPQDA